MQDFFYVPYCGKSLCMSAVILDSPGIHLLNRLIAAIDEFCDCTGAAWHRGNYEAAYGYLRKAIELGCDDNPYVLLGLDSSISLPYDSYDSDVRIS